jgi:small subunit ribosomal protein S16
MRATSIAVPAESTTLAAHAWSGMPGHVYLTRRLYSMAVVIRMMRAGAKKRPFYRVVVADSRRQRDGRFVEILGYYDPMAKPYEFKIDEEKVKGWIAEGAQPSEQAASLLRKHGIFASSASKPGKAKPEAKPKAKAASAKKKKAAGKPAELTARKAKNKAARVKKKANPKKRQPKKK